MFFVAYTITTADETSNLYWLHLFKPFPNNNKSIYIQTPWSDRVCLVFLCVSLVSVLDFANSAQQVPVRNSNARTLYRTSGVCSLRDVCVVWVSVTEKWAYIRYCVVLYQKKKKNNKHLLYKYNQAMTEKLLWVARNRASLSLYGSLWKRRWFRVVLIFHKKRNCGQ